MKRGYWLRTVAAAMLIFAGATQQLAAYEPYSQFKEFSFGGGNGTSVTAVAPQGMMWVIENTSGQILVPVGEVISNIIIFQQSPVGSAEQVIFPSPVLTSPSAPVGSQGALADVYFFNDAARAYYSHPVTINAALDLLEGQDADISISLTGYLVPLSTVWTGLTQLYAGDIKEVTLNELQLAETLSNGDAILMLSTPVITPGGELRVGAGKRLRFTGTTPPLDPHVYNSVNYNGGSIQALGNATSTSEIEFIGSLTNAPSTGFITAHDAALRFTGGLDNYGAVSLTRGGNDVFGDITNQPGGTIVVAGGANTTFYDDITQNGTLRVAKVGSTTSTAVFLGAFTGNGGTTGGGDIFFEGDLRPGNSPANVIFANNVGLGGEATTIIELAGATSGQFDQINVTGGLSLDGVLSVFLLGSFTPTAGNSFDILNWGSIDGTFASLQLPALTSGLTWNTSQLYTAGILSVNAIAGVPGDYNNSGTVDAADYVHWRNGGPLANEVDAPGTTNAADYTAWRARFGNTSGSGSSLEGSAVPEPNLVLVVVGAIAAGWLVRRRPCTL